MASSALATAFVNIVPGTTAVENYLKTQLGGQVADAGNVAGDKLAGGLAGGFGSKIKGYLAPVLGTMAATFAAVQIKDFLGDSIRNASDLNEAGTATIQIFGDAAKTIQGFASGASSIGLNAIAATDAAKTFGIFGKSAGLANGANAEFSKNLVGLSADLASFNNTTVDEAIQALGAGLRGEAEPLRRFGVLLDDFTLRQKAMEMGLTKTTKNALTPQQKVLAAYGVIMEQTSTQQGDFGRTSDGLANQQRILSATFDNMKTSLGQKLLPAMVDLAHFANDVLLPGLQGIGSFFGTYGPVIGAFAGTIALLTLAINAQAIATGIASSATWVWTAALLANPTTWIVLGVAALVAGIVLLATKTTFFSDAWKAMTKFVTDAWNGVVSVFTSFANWISANWKTILSWILFPALNVIQLIIDNWGGITKFFANLWNGIVAFMKTVWASLVAGATAAVNGVVSFFQTMPGKVIAFLQGLPSAIIGLFANAGTFLVSAGRNIVQGLINGAAQLLPQIGKFFLDLLPSWIRDPFKAALGIHSPSKVFTEFGKNIVRGLTDGLTGDAAKVKDTMDKVANWVTDSFNAKKISKKTAKAARGIIASYSAQLNAAAAQHDAVMQKLSDAEDTLKSKIDERLSFVKSIQSKFGSAFSVDRKSNDQLAIMRQQDAVAEAQKKKADAVGKFGLTSREATIATLELNQAQSELDNMVNGTTAAGVMKQLQDRITANKEMTSVLSQLQALGISGDLYQQILESGSLELAQSILAGGSQAVTSLNDLAAQANATALKLGEDAGNILYGKGIEVAQGVVDGLKAKESELSTFMANLGAAFASAMNAVIGADTTQADAAAAAKNKTAGKAAPKTTSKVSTTKAGAAVKSVSSKVSQITKKKLATGGLVNRPLRALIGEAGPELVTPLKDFERMAAAANGSGPNITYVAAPNQSLDAEQALFQAIKRAKVVAAW